MKHAYIILAIIILTSCTQEKDYKISDQSAVELPAIPKGNGVVPEDHPFYKEIQENINFVSLNDIDSFYIDNISKDNNHYTENLKNEAIFLIFAKGLVENGNNSQKLYYLNELSALRQSLPNIKNYYLLLKSCSFLNNNSKKAFADDFYKKNSAIINGMAWDDDDSYQKIKTGLVEGYRSL